MKQIIAFISLVSLFLKGRSQTFAEWFEQNKTQLRYLRAQIIALNEYDDALEDGCAIADTGLTRIASDKAEDLRQQVQYFATQSNVSITIVADNRVGAILHMSTETSRLTDRIRQIGSESPLLKPSLDELCDHLLDRCISDLQTLTMLLQDGVISLFDAKRLARLQELYEDVEETTFTAINTLVEVTTASSN